MRDSITCCSISTRFLPSNTSTSKTAASPKPPSPPSPPISVDLLYCKRHSLESHPSLKEVNIEGEVLSEETRAELLLITGYSHCSVLCTSPSSPSNSISGRKWTSNRRRPFLRFHFLPNKANFWIAGKPSKLSTGPPFPPSRFDPFPRLFVEI